MSPFIGYLVYYDVTRNFSENIFPKKDDLNSYIWVVTLTYGILS